MDPFSCLMGDYEARGAAVHWVPGVGFIAAVATVCGRTLYRIHRRDDFAGLPGLVPGKAAALAALAG